MALVMGDFRARFGNKNADMETVMGRHGLGSMSEKGKILTDFCVSNEIKFGYHLSP